jgi:hypothetical protein
VGDAIGPVEGPTKRCKECLLDLPVGRFRIHQKYRDGRSSRCKPCVRERAERKKLRRALQDRELERPRYYWDGYTARCLACNGGLYYDGEDVMCRWCGAQVTTARQPTPLVLTRLRLLRLGTGPS